MLSAIMDVIVSLIEGALYVIVYLINYILSFYWYQIAEIFFKILDFIQKLFRKLAGLDVVYSNVSGSTGSYENTDIASLILGSDVIKQTFISLIIVALFILFIFTMFQIIRQEYTTEGAKNSKGNVVKLAFKGLMNMIIIPVSCIVGIYFSGIILRLLDQATSNSEDITISGAIFKCGTYKSNCVRVGYKLPEIIVGPRLLVSLLSSSIVSAFTYDTTGTTAVGLVEVTSGEFTMVNKSFEKAGISDTSLVGEDLASAIDDKFAGESNGKLTYLSYSDVTYFYNVGTINFFVIYFVCLLTIGLLLNACFGLILRLYYIAILFCISPPIVATSVIDEKNKIYGKWKKKMMGNILGTYGVIISFNMFFKIVAKLQSISLFKFGELGVGSLSTGFYNSLVQILFVLVGCYGLNQITKSLAGILGVEDVMSQGKEVSDKVKKAAATAIKAAALIAATIVTAGAGAAAAGAGAAAKGAGAAAQGAQAAAQGAQGVAKVGDAAKATQNIKGSGIGDKVGGEGPKPETPSADTSTPESSPLEGSENSPDGNTADSTVDESNPTENGNDSSGDQTGDEGDNQTEGEEDNQAEGEEDSEGEENGDVEEDDDSNADASADSGGQKIEPKPLINTGDIGKKSKKRKLVEKILPNKWVDGMDSYFAKPKNLEKAKDFQTRAVYTHAIARGVSKHLLQSLLSDFQIYGIINEETGGLFKVFGGQGYYETTGQMVADLGDIGSTTSDTVQKNRMVEDMERQDKRQHDKFGAIEQFDILQESKSIAEKFKSSINNYNEAQLQALNTIVDEFKKGKATLRDVWRASNQFNVDNNGRQEISELVTGEDFDATDFMNKVQDIINRNGIKSHFADGSECAIALKNLEDAASNGNVFAIKKAMEDDAFKKLRDMGFEVSNFSSELKDILNETFKAYSEKIEQRRRLK